MGLDMRPLGKPKAGFEERYLELFKIISEDAIPQPSLLSKLKGIKVPTKEELLQEWFDSQIPAYETIKAPRVGREAAADAWIKERYEELEEKPPLEDYLKEYEGYYVIELATETVGVPFYIALGQDRNVFRGEFLQFCVPLLGEALVEEAWETKLAAATLDYGERLMQVAESRAKEEGLEFLKEQRVSPETEEHDIASQLHIVFSLAKWLIFYGKNGHGYEADY